jgi:hypothetical protein
VRKKSSLVTVNKFPENVAMFRILGTTVATENAFSKI